MFLALAIIAAGVAAHCARSTGSSFVPGSSSAKAVVTAVGAAHGMGLSGNRNRFVDGAGSGVEKKFGRGVPGRRGLAGGRSREAVARLHDNSE
jgi:hypothetical protein